MRDASLPAFSSTISAASLSCSSPDWLMKEEPGTDGGHVTSCAVGWWQERCDGGTVDRTPYFGCRWFKAGSLVGCACTTWRAALGPLALKVARATCCSSLDWWNWASSRSRLITGSRNTQAWHLMCPRTVDAEVHSSLSPSVILWSCCVGSIRTWGTLPVCIFFCYQYSWGAQTPIPLLDHCWNIANGWDIWPT